MRCVRSKRFKVLEAIVRDLPIERPAKQPTSADRVTAATSIDEVQELLEATRKQYLDPDRAERMDGERP